MSIEKCKLEAKRWLITAKDDLDTATILRKNNKLTIYSGLHSYNICKWKKDLAAKYRFGFSGFYIDWIYRGPAPLEASYQNKGHRS